MEGIGGIEAVMATGNGVLLDAAMKCRSVLESHVRACVSVSGGADSDCMMDLVERVRAGTGCDVAYTFFSTGLEYRATLDHLSHLEDRYGVEIVRMRPKKSVPTSCREHGQPFCNKFVSECIERLQRHGFQWEDEPMGVLLDRYPGCTSAIKWWCNGWSRIPGRPGSFDIGRNRGLKEFMVANPPTFRISAKCCLFAKKRTGAEANERYGCDVMLVGVRRAEGGIRSVSSNASTCYTSREGHIDTYRPLFWMSDADRDQWCDTFGVTHSDCYTRYGFKRTGCTGCPFNRRLFEDLEVTRRFEPKLHKACTAVFSESYEYTRKYREFQARMRSGTSGQMSLGI